VSRIYAPAQRRLKDRFDTRRLADLLEEAILHAEFTPQEKSFIEAHSTWCLECSEPTFRMAALGQEQCSDPRLRRPASHPSQA
jgi:hypothetical protein